MSQQKSAYFLITVSFVMGMIATTSISGCDSGKKSESTPAAAPSSSLSGDGNSQIEMDKPAAGTETPAAAPAAEAPAAESATDKPAGEAPAASEPPAPAPAAGGN